MGVPEAELPPHHQVVVDRFIAACEADARIVAAFLGGSYAKGTADDFSDLDLGVITTDAAYEDFHAEREAFVRGLGQLLFFETFGSDVSVFFILADGTEGELATGGWSKFAHINSGPYRVLLDKQGVLAGATIPWQEVDPAEQTEMLRRLIFWFWHDVSHVITALAGAALVGVRPARRTASRLCESGPPATGLLGTG
jgi:hypothetical protein